MIYHENEEYKIRFFKNLRSGRFPLQDYLLSLDAKERLKIAKYIEYLRQNKGVLDEPYSRHITGKIRELRVDFARNRYRIFYFTFVGKNIILLHGFLKSTAKTPEREINQAEKNYLQVINHPDQYAN